ncbi:MAG: hypothetical protein ACREN7_02850 [Candidatus Dormibacteria bacterium]
MRRSSPGEIGPAAAGPQRLRQLETLVREARALRQRSSRLHRLVRELEDPEIMGHLERIQDAMERLVEAATEARALELQRTRRQLRGMTAEQEDDP